MGTCSKYEGVLPCRLLQWLWLLSLCSPSTSIHGRRSQGDGTSVLSLAGFGAGRSSFRIALFADLHFGESSADNWGPFQDYFSNSLMTSLLQDESPDFVIFLGDILTANNMPSPNATKFWDLALKAVIKKKLPWASVFGNHDDAAFEWPLDWFGEDGVPGVSGTKQYYRRTTRDELMQNEMAKASSFSRPGPKDIWPSMSNFVIRITYSNSTIVIMYFLDTGGGSYPEVISKRQVSWFDSVTRIINPDFSIPELVFWHIPSPAYKEVAPQLDSQGVCVGSINAESVAPQNEDNGMMEILSTRKSVKAIFSGHNHGLDWCCPYKSLWLCFARHTGYGGYGSWTRGARFIDIVKEPFGIKSWIKLDDDTIVGNITLA